MGSRPSPQAWVCGEREPCRRPSLPAACLPACHAGGGAGRRPARRLAQPGGAQTNAGGCSLPAADPCPPRPPPHRRIAFLGSGLLLTNYMGAIALAVRLPALFNPWTMAGGHAVLALILLYRTIKLDAAKYSQEAIKQYYAAIWWVVGDARAGGGELVVAHAAGRVRCCTAHVTCCSKAPARLAAAKHQQVRSAWQPCGESISRQRRWGPSTSAQRGSVCPTVPLNLPARPLPSPPFPQAQLLRRILAAAFPWGVVPFFPAPEADVVRAASARGPGAASYWRGGSSAAAATPLPGKAQGAALEAETWRVLQPAGER